MEGGQKNNINLEAGLDTSSSDMLVPVNMPKFAHNWQKFQGMYLPNSLRYEQDGWAVGWNVIEFDYVADFLEENGFFVTYRNKTRLPVNTVLVHEDKAEEPVASFDVVTAYSIVNAWNCDPSINSSNGTVTGRLGKKDFRIEWDQAAGAQVSDNVGTGKDENLRLGTSLNSDKSVKMTVTDEDETFDFDVKLLTPTALTYGAFAVPYSYLEKGKQYWKDGGVVLDGDNVTVFGQQVTGELDGNMLTFDFDDIVNLELQLSFSLVNYFMGASGFGTNSKDQNRNSSKFFSDAVSVTTSENNSEDALKKLGVSLNNAGFKVTSSVLSLEPKRSLNVRYNMPFWTGARVSMEESTPGNARRPDNNRWTLQYSGSPATQDVGGWQVRNTSPLNITVRSAFGPEREYNDITENITIDLPRFQGLAVKNTLVMNSGFHPFWVEINDGYMPLGGSKWPALDYRKAGHVKSHLFTFVDVSGCWYLEEYYRRYTAKDIRCIRLNDDIAGVSMDDARANAAYAAEKEAGFDDAVFAGMFQPAKTPAAWAAGQAAVAWDTVFTDEGYKGNTYTDTAVSYSEDGFWPFAKAPKCNVIVDGTTYTGVYWTDGYRIITDLEEYKTFIRGEKAAEPSPVYFENNAFNYDVTVVKADKYITDFDISRGADTWNIWYGAVEGAFDPFKEFSVDYKDDSFGWALGERVEATRNVSNASYDLYPALPYGFRLVKGKQFAYSMQLPAVNIKVLLGVLYRMVCCNEYKALVYDNDNVAPSFSARMFEHDQDVTDGYNRVVTGNVNGRIGIRFDKMVMGYMYADVTFYGANNYSIFNLVYAGDSPNFYVYNGLTTAPPAILESGSMDVKYRAKTRQAIEEYTVSLTKNTISVNGRQSGNARYWNDSTKDPVIVSNGSTVSYAKVLMGTLCYRLEYNTLSKTSELSASVNDGAPMKFVAEVPAGYNPEEDGLLLNMENDARGVPYNGGTVYCNNFITADLLVSNSDMPENIMLMFQLQAGKLSPGLFYFKSDLSMDTGNQIMPSLGKFMPNNILTGDNSVSSLKDNSAGGLTYMEFSMENVAQVTLYGAAQSADVPEQVTAGLQGSVPSHASVFLDDVYPELVNTLSAEVSEPVQAGANINVNVSLALGRFGATNLPVSCGSVTTMASCQAVSLAVKDEENKPTAVTLDVGGKTQDVRKDSVMKITFRSTEIFTGCGARIYQAEGAELVSADSQQVKFKLEGADYVYLPKSKQFDNKSLDIEGFAAEDYEEDIVENGNVIGKIVMGQSVKGKMRISCEINAVMKQVLGADGGDVASFSGDRLVLNVKGRTVQVDLRRVLALDSYVNVKSTDVRRPTKTKSIGRIDTSTVMQLLKQQWNTTVEVENFWWLDDKHILELNNFNFVLKRKVAGEVDDWAGDRFEKIWEKERGAYLPTSVKKYFVTSAWNGVPRLMVFEIVSDSVVKTTVYNPLDNFDKFSFELKINKVPLGTVLNADTSRLNTYAVLTAQHMVAHGSFSGTVTGDKLIFGIHADNNFMQWAVVVDLRQKRVDKIVQGYGYVGLKGELTGGQIPFDYFNEGYGFTGTVETLEKLKEKFTDNMEDNLYLSGPGMVVGTETMCWYIKQSVDGIVSHLEWNGSKFIPRKLPVTSNYSAVYDTPSFDAQMVGNITLKVRSLVDLIAGNPNSAIYTVLNVISKITALPSMFFLMPKYGTVAYCQQTLGQYAFVHYNNGHSLPRPDPKAGEIKTPEENKKSEFDDLSLLKEDSYSFGKSQFKQQASCSMGSTARFFSLSVMEATQKTVQFVERVISMNKETGANQVSDYSKLACQYVADTSVDIMSQAIIAEGHDKSITSSVNSSLSLNMFYSNSDKQRVFAGPGFVEHQFVADCVAQSATATHVEASQITMYLALPQIGLFIMKQLITIEQALVDGLYKQADAIKELSTTAFGSGGNIGSGIAVGIYVGAAVLNAHLLLMKAVHEVYEGVCNTLSAQGPNSFQSNALRNHNLSMEGQHKYGEKSETFMWPCWDIPSGGLKYTDEQVKADIKNTPWKLNMPMADNGSAIDNQLAGFNNHGNARQPSGINKGVAQIDHYTAMCRGVAVEKTLPEDMAMVIGAESILPVAKFKNENISVAEPAFAPSMSQDYVIDKEWGLSQYCTYGMQQWVAVKDTKVIDCPPSNILLLDDFLGIACPYTAVEVKRGMSKKYNRPYAITPTALAFNSTGYNSVFDNRLYHAFDGYSYRIVKWVGEPGLGKNKQTFYYAFQVNDRFKRGNKLPANEVQGAFKSDPQISLDSIDDVWTLTTVAAEEKGLQAGTIGEDKDNIRWAVPVFTEHVNTLPAAVKTLTAAPLAVVDGVTSLVTDLLNNQTAYKAPLSVDFTIGKDVYRATEEYICKVTTENGIDVVTDLVPMLGLVYLGSTPNIAYFYSKATRCYYTFSGGTSLNKMEMMERFRSIQKGYYDFVNQEVAMPALMTYARLNRFVQDTDTETDNIIVPVLGSGDVKGELPPPITTVFNDKSWYKMVSLPSGMAYQGPNRVIINRDVFLEYMTDTMKENLGKWERMPREKYNPVRRYRDRFRTVEKNVEVGVRGWTHNPFLLVTSPLGVSENTDCMFEWEITFCWPVEMDLIYGPDNYACVNIAAETMTPGGKVVSRPSHVFLTKELFTRKGSYGYYSFRYQSNNGAGNRERLHIWSDAYIAVSSLVCENKVITQRRTEQLTQQLDVQKMREL